MNEKSRSGLERFLGLFAGVRGGEGPTALLLTLNIFLILTSYYIMKPVREALILAGGGAELKAYMSAGQAILLLGFVPLYAALASRMPRRRLINLVTLFFVACLPVFYLLARFDIPLGVAFFLWIGIFNVSVPAQFWSFANDLYTPEQGKRLFAIVAFGASAGAVVGPTIAGRLMEPIGPYQLLLLAAAILVLSLLITNVIDTRETRRQKQGPADAAREIEEPIGTEGAYSLVFRNRYLLLIALMILFLNWVNTTGEYILGRVITRAAAEAIALDPGLSETAFIGKFYSDFYQIVNAVGLAIQLLLVSRIIKYVGVRIALLVLPLIALGGYLMMAVYPVLAVIRAIKTAENATDYSLQNTLRGVLFLPTTREQKYKAKQAIDTLFHRAGDVLSALVVYLGTTWLAFRTGQFAMFNLALVLIWIVLAIYIGIGFRRLSKSHELRGETYDET